MSEPSSEALEKASALTGPGVDRIGMSQRVASALQELMDAKRDAQEWAAHLNSRAQANLERAEAAESAYAELRATSIEKLRLLESQRADKAEADAALAWRRVTELQARGTQLVEERRAAQAQRSTPSACAHPEHRLCRLPSFGGGPGHRPIQIVQCGECFRVGVCAIGGTLDRPVASSIEWGHTGPAQEHDGVPCSEVSP